MRENIQNDLMRGAQIKLRWVVYWSLFALGFAVFSALAIWYLGHVTAVYEGKKAIGLPARAAAEQQWNRLCDPAVVPRCVDLNATTAGARVCLDEDNHAVEQKLPVNQRHNCNNLRFEASRDVDNEALGFALTDVCSHTPLLSMWCHCGFDESARERPWLWSLWKMLATAATIKALGIAAMMLAGVWPVLVAVYALAKRKVDQAAKVVAWGHVPTEDKDGCPLPPVPAMDRPLHLGEYASGKKLE
jgi:hypothetical protein